MEHLHHPPGKTHAETFDEVIARGFRRSDPAPMAMMHSDGAHEHAMFTVTAAAPAITAARLASVAAGAPLARREDQANLSPARRTALRNAIVRLVEDGKYIDLIRHHMDMSHNMHGSMGEVGLYRFLGWHRRYLVAMEREIQRVDAILRPGALDKLGIPYWRWQDPFPAWLAGFLPAKDPSTGQPPPPRKCASPPAKPDATDIHTLVSLFSIQMPHVVDPNDYTRFTWGLEGWGKRPDGTSLPAHNHGHAWIGGVMNNTSVSPTDPIFWLHHAEVDRLWEIWRQANPAAAPRLNGNDRTMDPWPESYDDLLDVAALGYAYDSLVP